MIKLEEVTLSEISEYLKIEMMDQKGSLVINPISNLYTFCIRVYNGKGESIMSNAFYVSSSPTGNCQTQSIGCFDSICWAINCFNCPIHKMRRFGDIIIYIIGKALSVAFKPQTLIDINVEYLQHIQNYFRPKLIAEYISTNNSKMANVLLWTILSTHKFGDNLQCKGRIIIESYENSDN